MADEQKTPAEGHADNAAPPKAPNAGAVTPRSYPPSRADDSVEPIRRPVDVAGEDPSFDPAGDAANPRRMGPGGDPAEGKPS